ncbi:MAG: hypothetical protein A3F94_01080 [Candidatus Spechtbacteria bacterium RIFCSPLOWO2_12_FULL_38_22]|uniref:Antitoxin n=1 Tax=Candidatus Spechtbacteria bacterium RIFCSPLOWO2_12_FULL_38_22 TaxID=1802165 RepID=A0A1G2HID8_9BACT|nr:MAG: hypothetical protein A2728_01615 [Candidatus Spechtbacteria bacterium RIFCSPHIGHO2_01_FULL_38_11]OGZ59286.1 MAG: hypothetical protein A3E58_02720 [Candidatus Spechtbacteria bacterium RIFCSPHIGHO2_12_FULL_38_30]OGZ60756.1 MAG: hypothetical protein A3A00_02505 [Candidatus Spechtbacteria bacterium RIFCSPLOWO2_01_FULL_38_20]OGZ62159.1 MAG: hypothetical protein A3F94_01080 [Candidatus Spechtbacteria bacterium RIFCSPLOWO2_12_FULL_38_22]
MWDKLKKILKTSNEKAVIIEDGEPRYVVLSVDEYMRLNELVQPIQNQPQASLNQDMYSGNQYTTIQPLESVQPQEASDNYNTRPLDLSNLQIDLTDIGDENSLPQISLGDGYGSDVSIEDLPI